jgi:hypothetical protein
MSKPLAKSLHTVTAIVQVARFYKATHDARFYKATHDGIGFDDAVHAALSILGYDMRVTPDVYGLADKALSIVKKGAAA